MTETQLPDRNLSGQPTVSPHQWAWLSTIQNAVYTGKQRSDAVLYDDLGAHATSYRRLDRLLMPWNRQGAPPPGAGYYSIFVSHCNQRTIDEYLYPFSKS
ncbi:hypothetical protein [Spirosoma foliorum]|uniref:Uncharacterized protein n=1 Tax=Spirosoma foliorum TaxID=2710596 RepID=A0A7G5GZ63_9BACT|nr:hypothetical protein [Spirosoma foliorum]QMW04155.1 hypothetical protein H3H32_04140 [Spirosoma foliorum]